MMSIVIGILYFLGMAIYLIVSDLITIIKNFKYGYIIVLFYIAMAIFLIYGYTHMS